MAKRFTDTAKWSKPNFCNLSLKMKLVWVYLCDNCDHAGVWDANFGLMSYQLGVRVTQNELINTFGEKIEVRGDKVVIPSFIEFQYGILNPENRVHQSVISRLLKINENKPLTSPLQGAKDKDKDTDKDKDKDKDPESFEKFWAVYPKRDGKAKAQKSFYRFVKLPDELTAVVIAASNYATNCEIHNTESKFIKHPTTFLQDGYWREWVTRLSIAQPKSDLSSIFGKAGA